MIKLTSRQKALVSLLAKQDKIIKIKDIANYLSCNERAIRYDLIQIEEYLKENNIKLTRKSRLGIGLDIDKKKKNELLDIIGKNSSKDLILTNSERKQALKTLLFFTNKVLTTTEMADKLFVSRQTVVSDLKEIKNELQNNKISLVAVKGSGTYVDGDEKVIRDIMWKYACENNEEVNLNNHFNLTTSYLDKVFNEGTAKQKLIIDFYRKQNIDLMNNEITETFAYNNCYMNDKDYVNFVSDILINISRIKKEKYISKQTIDIKENKNELDVATTLAKKLENNFNITINVDEINYLAINLIRHNLKFNNQNINENNLSEIVDEMLKVLYQEPGFDLPMYYRDKLKVSLIYHLQLSIKKYRLKLVSKNILLKSIKQNYPNIFAVAQKMAKVFEEKTHIPLNEDELGFLTIHIAANKEECSKLSTKTAIIVCNTGTGVAKVLLNRIKHNIPRLIVKDTRAYLNLNKEELKDVDLIISTFNIPDPGKPVFVVSPIISSEEIGEITKYIYGSSDEGNNNNSFVSSLDELLNNYLSDEEAGRFRNDLSKILPYEDRAGENLSRDKVIMFQSSLIIAAICNLVLDGQKEFGYVVENDKLCGLIIHVLMQIPNYKRKEIQHNNKTDDIKNKNIELFQYLVTSLNDLSKEFNILIPEEEALSIMHYIL